MSPEERDRAYLWDMFENGRQVLEFTRGVSFESYAIDSMRRMAVERGLEVLGEAAKRISASFKAEHPEIPWHSLVGLRNVLSHDYGEIDQHRIWEIATKNTPELIGALRPLVPVGSD